MKSFLLFLETVLLAGPITGLVAWFSVPTLIMYAGLLLQLFIPGQDQGSVTSEDLPIFAAIAAFPLGAFALVQLWALAINTAKGRKYRFGRVFWLAFACGAVSVLALGAALNFSGTLVVCLPAYLLFAHMAYLQKRLANAA